MERDGRNVTRVVSAFVAEGLSEHATAELQHAVSRVVYDTLAVMIGGRDTPLVQRTTQALAQSGRAPSGALVYGIMAHVHDFDDYLALVGHPSAVLVPTLLALHGDRPLTSAEATEAYSIGFEIWSRMGASSRGHYERGFHTTGTLGALGSTALASRVGGLSEEDTAAALGVAAAGASGLRGSFGSDMKPYQLGRAAAMGIEAVDLTLAGIRGPANTLDSAAGFLAAFLGAEPAAEARLALTALADIQDQDLAMILEPPMAKPYPCCGGTHGAVDAALALRTRLTQEQICAIDSVRAVVPSYYQNALQQRIPMTGVAGKFSLEYCIATTLLRGRPGVDAFTDHAVSDPAVIKLAERVTRDYREDLDELVMDSLMPATVECSTGGEVFTEAVVRQTGGPGRPLSDEDLVEKTRANARAGEEEILEALAVALKESDVAGMLELGKSFLAPVLLDN